MKRDERTGEERRGEDGKTTKEENGREARDGGKKRR